MEFIIVLIKAFVVLQIALGLASFCTWVERKGSALIQDRVGANRAGAFFQTDIWLLKPIFVVIRFLGMLGVINTLLCDAVKALFKEDFLPEGTSNFIHSLAPFLAGLPVFLSFAFIPFSPDFELFGYQIRFQVAEVDAGILWLFAMGGVAVYGTAIAGWCGNNKFSLLGGLRAAAQMISYELAMGVAFATVILSYGTLQLYDMVAAQSNGVWGILTQPITAVVLFIVGMAETKRAPFDLPEAESEIVAGYFTEYSGMKFLLFWLAEFAEIALFSLILAILFFGGWHLPFVSFEEGSIVGALVGHTVLMAKVLFLCVLQIVIRWTLPRFRYDQLMGLGWKVLLPLSLANLFVTAFFKLWLK